MKIKELSGHHIEAFQARIQPLGLNFLGGPKQTEAFSQFLMELPKLLQKWCGIPAASPGSSGAVAGWHVKLLLFPTIKGFRFVSMDTA